MLIDAHAHLDKYDDDEIDVVLAAIERQGILTMSVSVDVASFERAEAIAARSSLVVPGFGIHPWAAPELMDSLAGLEDLAVRSPLIGEIGLDYRFVTDAACYGPQRQVFANLLELAQDQNKLVNVHCAGAERDTADMLRSHRTERAIIHWYSGPLDILSQLIASGFMFTIGVEVLYSDHIRDVAQAIPTDQLLTETDNPGGSHWLTGKRGYPPLITDIASELARIRGVHREELLATVNSNMAQLLEDDRHLEPWLAELHK